MKIKATSKDITITIIIVVIMHLEDNITSNVKTEFWTNIVAKILYKPVSSDLQLRLNINKNNAQVIIYLFRLGGFVNLLLSIIGFLYFLPIFQSTF